MWTHRVIKSINWNSKSRFTVITDKNEFTIVGLLVIYLETNFMHFSTDLLDVDVKSSQEKKTVYVSQKIYQSNPGTQLITLGIPKERPAEGLVFQFSRVNQLDDKRAKNVTWGRHLESKLDPSPAFLARR